ncbi:hypothetical protein LZ24_03275 [Desulfobotulus alkaliphilus]|uniref:Uncharacterized protein n=2 Tax=Desulfobotulus alkaliphilus TaxID=622671 RepID=A0A562R4T0_9BACT|nr:hypothetical protein LZ24_03275 [Desulfobotulus alkaliphilus]
MNHTSGQLHGGHEDIRKLPPEPSQSFESLSHLPDGKGDDNTSGFQAPAKENPDFLSYILYRMIPPSLIVLFLMGCIIIAVTRSFILANAQERLEYEADREQQRIEEKIKDIKKIASSLAGNDLIINGLIDTLERERYLPLFFQSLNFTGSVSSHIALLDFAGQVIVSNEQKNFCASCIKAAEHLKKSGLPIYFDKNILMIASPVLIHGFHEGTVIISP